MGCRDANTHENATAGGCVSMPIPDMYRNGDT
jgi:hypothetical protein